MTKTSAVFEDTTRKAHEWLRELMAELTIADERQGLRALRAGLHAIRDRLPAAEVVALGAQLPILIRGYYYDGWRIAGDPSKIRTREQLVAHVRDELRDDPRLEAEAVLRAVIRVIAWHVSAGEVDEIVHTLPRRIADLFQDSMA